MLRLRIVCFIFGFFIVSVVIATPAPDCILLGPQPSFIIKFKNSPSDLLHSSQLNSSLLNRLSEFSQLQFTHSRAMAGGAYIIFFKPLNSFCYSQEQLTTIVAQIMQDSAVEYITPNRRAYLTMLDTRQWDMKVPALGGIDAVDAWTTTQGNSNVIVADLDTGVFLNNSLAPNLRSGVSFINNGNWAVGATPSCDFNVCEGSEHGTHTAGTIAASGVLAYDANIFGVAPAANLLPINVFTKFTGESECGTGIFSCLASNEADYLNAVYWLMGSTFSGLGPAPAVVAINMSFGANNAPCDQAQQDAFNLLVKHNITPVAAAGNSNIDMVNFSPANCSNVIAVGATGPTQLKANYSNWGSKVALAAPGGDATLRGLQTDEIYSTSDKTYEWMQGTSMATPHVTGLTALLYARDPTVTPTKVLQVMQSTATLFATGTSPRSCAAPTLCGAGIINANAAVAAISVPTLIWSPNFTVTALSGTSVQIDWDATSWSNQATTSIIYRVMLDSIAVSTCQNISVTTCVLTNITGGITAEHSFAVTATDYRQILTSAPQSGSFGNIFMAPTVTSATRNFVVPTHGWISYSDVGTYYPNNIYTIVGLPSGTTVTLDLIKKRFVIDNILTPQAATVYIRVNSLDGRTVNTATLRLPSIVG